MNLWRVDPYSLPSQWRAMRELADFPFGSASGMADRDDGTAVVVVGGLPVRVWMSRRWGSGHVPPWMWDRLRPDDRPGGWGYTDESFLRHANQVIGMVRRSRSFQRLGPEVPHQFTWFAREIAYRRKLLRQEEERRAISAVIGRCGRGLHVRLGRPVRLAG